MSLNPIKLVTIVGTRPEIIRLSRIIDRLNNSDSFSHTLVHTGQNYDYNLNDIFFKDLSISKPDIYLDASSENSSKTIGNILIKVDDVLDEIKPDAVLVLGDTNSCLSVLCAKKRKIPIFHFEAGNRCFDQRVPEENNRKLVDHVSDINLTYSNHARQYLINEGIPPDRVIKIGSPMFEVLSYYKKNIDGSNIIKELSLKKGKYFLVSCHREENVDNPNKFLKFIKSLNELSNIYNIPIVFPIHPRTKKILESTNLKLNNLIQIIQPIGFVDYINLQINSFVVLSDSGTIFEESSILNFNAINLRESHERPAALEEAQVLVSGMNLERILQCINIIKTKSNSVEIQKVKDYMVPNVSVKIERIIPSYIDYINRVVWQKEF